MFGRRGILGPAIPKQSLFFRVRESCDSASRNPRCSRSGLDSATTNPRAQQISAARIIIEVGETNVSFGPRFLGRAVSRQAIFPLSRVTQPRRHNSFLHGTITTRREETERRRRSRVQMMLRALTGPSVQ